MLTLTSLKPLGYWFITGTCIGLGLILIFSLGIALLLAAVLLIAYGVKRIGTAHLWSAMLGFGLAPALLLTYQYLLPRNGQAAANFPSGYVAITITCWAIALVGLLWGASKLRTHQHD